MKELPVELVPNLRIGVGVGNITLAYKEVKDDGFELWYCTFRLRSDGPVRDTFAASSHIIREIMKVEKLEKKAESQRKSIAYWKRRADEIQVQLAESEKKRDVAHRLNQETFKNQESDINRLRSIVKASELANHQLTNKIDQMNLWSELAEDKIKNLKTNFSSARFLAFVGWISFLLSLGGLLILKGLV